ncbi:MAG TPA: hypothetical protein VGF36_17760 [Rhodopila sp.]
MRPTNDSTARFLLPTIAGLVCLLLVVGAASAIAAMTHAVPRVGDIIAFTPVPNQTIEGSTRLIVHRPGKFGCVLDLGILRRSGGSLVVEGEMTDAAGNFRVHWAGPRTSADTGNCGDHADLVLDGPELDLLALSAGGYGAVQKRMPFLVNDNTI